MGGGSTVSNSTQYEDSCFNEDFHFLSSPRESRGFQDKDNSEIEKNERNRLGVYQEILHSYDELMIDSNNLKEAKEKILRYRPGTWIGKANGLKLCDYDIPDTTCLILVGPRGSGKSSLINRISNMFDDDEFAPDRAQVLYNSLGGNGTYFLREYMIPRDSSSICLYDTRSLSDNSQENSIMLRNWMKKGVRHGELVARSTDNQRLSESLKLKDEKKGFFSSKSRKVNFVIFVLNGVSVLNVMENAGGALEARYIEEIVSTFNFPFLSFKDDKPVLVLTHGDLLSLSDRARVRAYLGELLGIPPTKQIFDIPDCDDLVTESAIIGMLRYTLEQADRNIPQKSNVMNKVHKISLSLFMILLILAIGFAIGLKQNSSVTYVTQPQAPQPHICCREVHDIRPNLEVPKKEPKIENPKLKVPKKEPKIKWHKIWHIIRSAWLPLNRCNTKNAM